jgi:cobalamin biosynthesis protein CbiD
VVEPKSSAAFRKTIARTLKAYRDHGVSAPVVTPGYVGERFLRRRAFRTTASCPWPTT